MNDIIGCDKCYKEVGIDVSLDAINDYSNTVAVTNDHDDSESFVFLPGERNNEFMFTEVDVSTVVAHLCALDIKKSTVQMGLSARFLKEITNEISETLTALFNYSLQYGVIPSAWKQSNITPVHKGGAKDDQ